MNFLIYIIVTIFLYLFCFNTCSEANDTNINKTEESIADNRYINNISFLQSKSKIDSFMEILSDSIKSEVEFDRMERVGDKFVANIAVSWDFDRDSLIRIADALEDLCFESRSDLRKSIINLDAGILCCNFKNETYKQELYSYFYNYRIWIRINTENSVRIIPVLAYRTMLFKNKTNILEAYKSTGAGMPLITSTVIMAHGGY